jgi:hypothetical protein
MTKPNPELLDTLRSMAGECVILSGRPWYVISFDMPESRYRYYVLMDKVPEIPEAENVEIEPFLPGKDKCFKQTLNKEEGNGRINNEQCRSDQAVF